MKTPRPLLAAALLAIAILPSALLAGESRTLNGRSYLLKAGGWVQLDAAGREFALDPRVITVRFRPDAGPQAQQALVAALGGEVLRRASTGFVDIEIAAGQDVFKGVDAFLASGLVELAEPNNHGEYTIVPDDPSYPSEWHLPIIDAPEAWDTTTGSASVIVAILDSGTEFDHEDLGTGTDAYQNIWLNPGEDAWSSPNNPATGNGMDDDLNGLVDDWKGWDFNNNNNDPAGPFFHGTAVAGATAAKTNNDTDVAGVAGGWNGPGVRLMIGGVGDNAPNGAILDDAILYALAEGARVIQLSLTVGQTAALDAALAAAHAGGLTIVCASGNDGASSVGYPSSHADVIAIGSTTAGDLRSSFSNQGSDLDLSAPGSGIVLLDTNDGTTTSSGTSFAAPIVSGVVGLMLSVNPNLTPDEVLGILRDTADKVGGYDYNWNAGMPGHSFELGYGRVDAAAAVAAANEGLFADGFESGDTSAWTSTVP